MATSGRPSPFAIEEGLYRILEKGFEHFVGRTQLREQLLSAVTKDPRIWIINVHGPGGVGKSALVNWCVNEHYEKRNFEAIIQLTAKDTVLTSTGIQEQSRSLFSIDNLLEHVLITFGESVPESLDRKQDAVIEILSAWKTLLVLDNMETVNDGRILTFAQNLPHDTKTKVLITSRSKTGGWELPIPVTEMGQDEVREFVFIRQKELSIEFPCDDFSISKLWKVTGGLPLAVQWVMGRYKLTGKFDQTIGSVNHKDSPVLEFSFRNIWNILDQDARTVLAVTSIFNDPPTSQQLSIALDYALDRIDRALVSVTRTAS